MQYDNYLAVISENLRLLRRLFGYSQNTVAEALELSRTSYCEIEKGRACMNLYSAMLLSILYGITLDSILDPELSSKVFTRLML